RYPGASTLEAFWDNLRADRDLITEVPPDRWDHEAWFDARPGTLGRSYSRWGGFLDGVDQFDPLFFNIAPGEAAGIDPNERLFLETCWEALENAGHTRASLSRDRDRSIGVYAGVMYGEYQVLAAAAQAAGAGGVGGASPYWSIANRVSYHLDLHGPSVAVDTACSSSLTAIHLACQALATGECTVAIAGGVNLSLHPLKYVGLSQGRFAASDGRCHSFTAGGDGYVPGEGVGAVVLKPLAAALADGDFVHAVIRGWSANHGGKTNGYTVPNPVQQGAVIAAALRKGGVEPASISYVEAHGTGTALGDPIEVAGLAAAFGDDVPRQSCALGSVKANIGHLEAAAGIAGLTRVVLQLQHRTLTPTRRHGADNPNIDFAVTPFRLQYKTEAWDGPTPLRAGLSSFGAGGANAHLVVEEWRTPRADAASGDLPALLVLSARTEAQLRAYAARMAVFLRHSPYRLADVCRTLQVGREAMAVRLAAVVGSLAEAADLLAAHAAGTACAALTGTVEDSSGPTPASMADLRVLARAWVEGADIDWTSLAVPGDRVPLPPHPFMRRRYWLEMPSFPMAVATGTGRLHRFLDRVEPSMDGAVFVRRFDRTDPVVRDHVVQGRYLVPGVVQLEMVRAAATAAAIPVGQSGTGLPMAGLPVLADIAWPSPFEVPEAGTDARVILRRTGDGIGFEIRVGGDVLVCQGRLVAAVPAAGERLAPAALIARAERHLVAAAIYDRLSTLGLAYGPALRSLTDVWICGDRVVAALAAPVAEPDVAWLPGVLDGALQSLLGFADTAETRLLVPFALGRVDATGDLAQARFVVGARRQAADGRATFDLTVTDTEGAPLLHLSDLTARSVGSPGAAASDLPLTLCRPVWSIEPTPLAIAADTVVAIVRDGDDGGIATALARTLGANRIDVVDMDHPAIGEATDLVWVVAPSRDPGQDGPVLAAAAEAAALALLHAIQALDRVGRLGRDLRLRIVTRGLQSVSPREAPDPIAGAVLGVAKCVALEYPRVSVTLTDLDDQALAHPDLAAMILAEPPTLPVREVAWRGGQRHALTMAPFDARGTGEALRPGASVLIVGGAGGIGLELAAWLTREHGARVALVGRRPINEVADRIAAVSSGSGSIRYLQADATDHAAMRDVVEDLRGAWGGIDIAIHAALVLRDRTVARMDEATFRAVLAPKVAGSIALAEALADEPLQVLAFLSSVNVISGSRGQSNYVAGSSFADAYARSLSSTRPWRVVVTDWGLWGDVGVVSDETYRLRLSRLGVHPIRPAEGIATLAAILAGNADRVAVARAEPAALRQLGLAVAPPVADLTGAEAGFAALERHGRVTLRNVLDRLAGEPSGKAWTTEGLRRHLGIAPRHATLFAALLDALGRDGLIGETDGLWRLSPIAPGLADTARAALDRAQQAAPWLAGPRRLLQTCLDAYPALLRGELDPVAVLFPQASMDLVVAAYDGNPIADHFNTEIAAAVRSAVAEAAPGQGLRILELG
ncbi:MAG: type I polyketide synthase, partial [Acetobacteraceae bacterium]